MGIIWRFLIPHFWKAGFADNRRVDMNLGSSRSPHWRAPTQVCLGAHKRQGDQALLGSDPWVRRLPRVSRETHGMQPIYPRDGVDEIGRYRSVERPCLESHWQNLWRNIRSFVTPCTLSGLDNLILSDVYVPSWFLCCPSRPEAVWTFVSPLPADGAPRYGHGVYFLPTACKGTRWRFSV